MNRLINTKLLAKSDDDLPDWDVISADLLRHESVYRQDGQEFSTERSEDDIEILSGSESVTDDSFSDFRSEQTLDQKYKQQYPAFPSFCDVYAEGEVEWQPGRSEQTLAISRSASSSSIETLDITRPTRVESLCNVRNVLEDGKRSLFELYDIQYDDQTSRPDAELKALSNGMRRRKCSTQNSLCNGAGGYMSCCAKPCRRRDAGERQIKPDIRKRSADDATSYHLQHLYDAAVGKCRRWMDDWCIRPARRHSTATASAPSASGTTASQTASRPASMIDDWRPGPGVLGVVVLLGLLVVFTFGVHVGYNVNSSRRVRNEDPVSVTQSDEFLTCSHQKQILEERLKSSTKKGDKEVVVSSIWRQKFEEVIFENAELELKLGALESQMTQSLKLARDNIAALSAEVQLFRDEVNEMKRNSQLKKRLADYPSLSDTDVLHRARKNRMWTF